MSSTGTVSPSPVKLFPLQLSLKWLIFSFSSTSAGTARASGHIHQWTMHRALYSFLHQLVRGSSTNMETWIASCVVVICSPCSSSAENHNNHHARCSTFCFHLSFSITGMSSAICLTTICSMLPHLFFNFRCTPRYVSRHTSTLSPWWSPTTPALQS